LSRHFGGIVAKIRKVFGRFFAKRQFFLRNREYGWFFVGKDMGLFFFVFSKRFEIFCSFVIFRGLFDCFLQQIGIFMQSGEKGVEKRIEVWYNEEDGEICLLGKGRACE
jgi:hypothetical protein